MLKYLIIYIESPNLIDNLGFTGESTLIGYDVPELSVGLLYPLPFDGQYILF